jgi:hypothetical protein
MKHKHLRKILGNPSILKLKLVLTENAYLLFANEYFR